MKKFVMLTVVALLVRPAYCAVTAHLSLDCREGAKIADTTHPLIYDASWYAGGVTSKITANGQEIVSGAAGACAWAPSSDGVCLLTLSVYNDSDEVVGTEQVFCLSREDLTELVIPEGTMEISDYAFAGGLFTSVTIPSSVTSIGAGAFFDCSGLMSIAVDEENASYCSVDGVLYDKAKTELLCHPAGKIGCMAIPEGVSSIGVDAFSGCSGLTSVVIPEGVMSIGSMAFFGCDGLEKVYVSVGDLKRVKEMLVASCSGIDVDSLTFVEMLADGGPYKETVNGIEWTFTIVDGEAMIGPGSWNSAAISKETVGEIEVPSVLGGRPVTSIGSSAFFYCSGLTSVTIPEGVTSIGVDAFYCCRGLTSVTIPKSVTSIGGDAFMGCSGLTSVIIPSRVTSIDGSVFSGCSGLTSVTIPSSVTSIGSSAFSGCSGLTSVAIPSSVTSIGDWAFVGCSGLTSVTIPSSVTSIGYEAFRDCSGLKSVTIPSSVTSIGAAAFSGCSSIESVTIPACVTSLSAVFPDSYTKIKNASICPGVTGIGEKAFSGCSGLMSVSIPPSVMSIGYGAFKECEELRRVDITDLTTWCKIEFDCDYGELGWDHLGAMAANPLHYGGKLYLNGVEVIDLVLPEEIRNVGAGSFIGCSGLKSVTMLGNVTNIGAVAFYGCSGLTSVIIPNRVTRIGAGAFCGCDGLTEVTIPNGVIVIEGDAFMRCEGLKVVRIAETVESIGGNAFRYCESLRAVYYYSMIPPAVGAKVYDDCPDSMISFINWSPSTDKWCERAWSQWDPQDGICTVAFDAVGGVCSTASKSLILGSELGLLPTPTRDGYEFLGWFTAAVGGTRVTAATVVTEDVTFYAQWSAEIIAIPVVDPPNGTVFRADDCLVTITTETDGAAIYYRVGAAPKASSKFLYSAPFTITDTSTIYTYAMKEGRSSATNVVTITKGEVLTFAEAASAEGITTFITDGDAEWIAEEDANAKVGNTSVRSGEIDDDQISWFTAEVEGPGTLSFWWKASCEADELQEFDHLVFAVDDVVEGEVARLDGITAWEQITTTISAGSHTLYWAYVKDESDFDGEDCGWVDGIVWTPSAAPVVGPTIEGDEGATVTGDAETGFVVEPSKDIENVEISLNGVDPSRVTVKVSVGVETVAAHGAMVKIVSEGADITEFLNVPAADGNGVVDLTKATVKEEIVKEVLDIKKGAKIELNAADPKFTTAPTRVGLFYQLREGETLGGMKDGDSKVGDGEPWSPKITVKGGNSAFYSIGVGKGE